MGRKGKVTIEAKSAADEAWYPCSLELGTKHVRVHFIDYDTDDDESWDMDGFETREDVLNRVRVTSEQLQDEECRNVSVGTRVCALKKLKKDWKFFDGVVSHITRRNHLITARGEECKCKFTVKWQGGPAKGRAEDLDCSAITICKDGGHEQHAQLKSLLDKVTQQVRKTPTQKRKDGNSRTPSSAGKKGKPDANVPDNVKDRRTQMTETDICSTIKEVCDAFQPNKSDADSKHPLKEKAGAENDQEGGKLWSATGHKKEVQGSLLNDRRGKTMDVGTSQSPVPTATGACRGGTLGNKSSSDCDMSKRNAAVPELGTTPHKEVVVLSDDDEDDKKSQTQTSPHPTASNSKAARALSQRQLDHSGGNAPEAMVQRVSDVDKICRGLWPINCILRIDNVEKDLCPQVAETFLNATIQDVICVLLFPAGDSETSRFGFVILKDSQATENALKLLTSNCMVASERQRPWVVSRAKDSDEEKEQIVFTARGSQQASLMTANIEPSASTNTESSERLRLVADQMDENQLLTELQELYLAHKKQLQALWKTFNREEAEKKLQRVY